MKLSVVIPVLDDAVPLARCLEALAGSGCIALCERLVVDGGSSAECRAVAERFCAAYMTAPRGRAAQMNAGARESHAEWLWFLHADCVPHADSVRALLALGGAVKWGCFRHRIDHPSRLLRVIESGDNFRARWLGLPYGDQGIFVRRDVFESLGGFKEVPLLEDVVLSQELKQQARPCVLEPLLKCDARRWLDQGIAQTTWTNWRIMFKYLIMKRSPEQIALLYRRAKSAEEKY